MPSCVTHSPFFTRSIAATFCLLSSSISLHPNRPSGCLSPDAGFHYTSIGLWLLPFPRAPVSSLPPAAQSPRLCSPHPPPSSPIDSLSPLLFPPSVSVSPFSHHLPLFRFVLPVLCPPSVLTTYSICHPKPSLPPIRILPPSPPSFSSLSLSLLFSESSSLRLLPVLPHLAISLCCARLSSLLSPSLPFLPLHFPECYWWRSWLPARNQEGVKREERVPSLPISPTVPSLSLPLCPPVSGPAVPAHFFLYVRRPPFLQHSLCCHSAVCLYFPCCQLHAWPQWQPWQLQTLCGPRYSLPGTPAERKEKGKKENLSSWKSASLANQWGPRVLLQYPIFALLMLLDLHSRCHVAELCIVVVCFLFWLVVSVVQCCSV